MNITKNGALRCARNGILGLLAALLVASCGGGGGGGGAGNPTSGLSLVAGRIDTLNGTGASARLTNPTGVAIDSKGNTYVTEPDLHIVRKITPDSVVTVFAGVVGIEGSTDGPAAQALFSYPKGITVDGNDNLLVAQRGAVRKISSNGVVSTVAGNLGFITSVAIDSAGTIYAGGYKSVVKISQGTVTPLVIAPGFAGTLYLAVDTSSNLYIGDSATGGPELESSGNAVVYRLAPNGTLLTLIGFAPQPVGTKAAFSLNGLATDLAGNVYVSNGMYYFSSTQNTGLLYTGNTIIRVNPNGLTRTVAGILGQTGSLDEAGASALFNNPKGLVVDPQGNIVVADSGNNTVRRISPLARVTTLAGNAPPTAPVDGTGSAAGFVQITGLALDKLGRIAVVEASAIRSLTKAGAVSTISALSIPASNPRYSGAAFDVAGNLYTARNNYAGTLSDSTIFKIASNGKATPVVTQSYFGQLAVDASGNIFGTNNNASSPITKISTGGATSFVTRYEKSLTALAISTSGDLYACTFDGTVIKISPSGTVSVLAGMAGKSGYADGEGSTALFRRPQGIAVDTAGNVFVADTENNVIRKITPDAVVSTVAGRFGFNDTVTGALPGGLYRPTHLAFDGDGSLLVTVSGVAVVRIRLP